jgi:hypothetical protein
VRLLPVFNFSLFLRALRWFSKDGGTTRLVGYDIRDRVSSLDPKEICTTY